MASNHNKNSNDSSAKNCDHGETMSPSVPSDETDKIDEIINRRIRLDLDRGERVSRKQRQTGQDTRREDNPFSFKHFLNSNSSQNYCHMGARPKVYPMNNIEQDLGVYSRNPTELPDFVQDHLVIEQCYLNHELSNQQSMNDADNLPDFTLNSQRQTKRHRNESKMMSQDNLPFDLTGTLDKGLSNRDHSSQSNATCSGPLDLPAFNNRPICASSERAESSGFPFDLQLPVSEPNTNNTSPAARDCAQPNDGTNSTKSLPDFLNDGPVRSRTTPSPDFGSVTNVMDSKHKLLLFENETLRYELEVARKQANERSKRIQELEAELASRKEVEYEETAHLEKAMEQVEDNLKRSRRRAVNAESTVTSLKKEIRDLKTEMSLLELENSELRSRISANLRTEGGSNVDRTIRRLAGDLRTAASTAELSLRQLMSGVDNLRVLASALENVDRIEDRTKDFLPDFDEDNATGPAL